MRFILVQADSKLNWKQHIQLNKCVGLIESFTTGAPLSIQGLKVFAPIGFIM